MTLSNKQQKHERRINKKTHMAIIVPLYNEKDNLINLYDRILKIMNNEKLKDIIWYILFVDDGSTDSSWEVISQLRIADSERVKGIRFSRNFGKESALTGGIDLVDNVDFVISLDADLQHPPEFIPDFIEKWKEGEHVVVGVRKSIADYTLAKQIGSKLFYKLMSLISDLEIVPNSTDFRLLDRSVLIELKQMKERSRIFRGLIDWLGFKKGYIYFDSPARQDGKKPSYTVRDLFSLALVSIISFSLRPLWITGCIGVLIVFCSLLLLAFMFITDFLAIFLYSTIAYFVVFNTMLMGIVLSGIGILAFYIGHMHTQLLKRPIYIVSEKI